MQMLENVLSLMRNQVNICPYSSAEVKCRDRNKSEM